MVREFAKISDHTGVPGFSRIMADSRLCRREDSIIQKVLRTDVSPHQRSSGPGHPFQGPGHFN